MSFTDSDSASDGCCAAGSFGSFIVLENECDNPRCNVNVCHGSTSETWMIDTNVAEIRAVLGSFRLTPSGLRIKQQPFSEVSKKQAFLDDTVPALHEMRISSASYQSFSAGEAACKQYSCASTHGMAANIAAVTRLAYMQRLQPVPAIGCITFCSSQDLDNKLARSLYLQQQMQQLEKLRQQYGSEQQPQQPGQPSTDVKKSDILVKLAGLPQQLYKKLKNNKRILKPPVCTSRCCSRTLAPKI